MNQHQRREAKRARRKRRLANLTEEQKAAKLEKHARGLLRGLRNMGGDPKR